MKNFIKSIAFTLAAGAFFASCEQDPCKDVACGTNGTCVEGTCNCEAGYEKDAANLCNTMQRTKFIHTWSVADNCSRSGMSNYAVVASSGSSISQVSFTNFWGLWTTAVVGTVGTNGMDITIARQQDGTSPYYVEGSGTINTAGTSISMMYVISDETDPTNILRDSCTATWTR